VQNLSPLHESAEIADFPKLDPDPMGMAEIKVAYNLVLLAGIPVVCMTFACHAPFGSDARTKIGIVLMYTVLR